MAGFDFGAEGFYLIGGDRLCFQSSEGVADIAGDMGELFVGGVAVWWCVFWLQGEWAEREAFVHPSAEVSRSVTMLERLHAGETESAMDTLEMSLDSGLIGLSLYKTNEFPSAQNNLIQVTLQRAKDYRSRHPRTNDSPEVAAAIAKALDNVDSWHADNL